MTRRVPRLRRYRRIVVPGVAAILALSIFAFYFLVYRQRHFPMPVGFDTSWYVWRARYVGDHGLGALDTAVRPGHALLASLLGGVTGRSQLQLAVVLPLALVSVFALAVGALACAGLGATGWRWAASVAVAGTLLGTTRLVGENVANLLLVALVAAALVALARWVGGERGFGGAIALFVAAGLAHWTFLAVIGVLVAVPAAAAVPSFRAERAAGVPAWRTQAGAAGAAVGATAALMITVIVGVLRAPFSTFEIKEDPKRFLPKFREDVSHLVLPLTAPLAGLGAAALLSDREDRPEAAGRRRSFLLRILSAWTAVCAAGVVYGAATRRLPPHRFLTLIVAVPGSLLLAAAVWWAVGAVGRATARRARQGISAAAAALVAAGVVIVLGVPGALSWYRHGPGIWLDEETVIESETAARYLQTLPPHTPVVFLVGPLGPAGLISVPLKERNLRVGLPTDREPDVHVFVGSPADLLAGRRTHVSGPIDAETEPYWRDVRAVLFAHPPVVVLKSLGPDEYAAAVSLGAKPVGPDVVVLQGPATPSPFPRPPSPRPVPRTMAGMAWGAVLLLLLAVAGVGWADVVLGPGAPREVFWSLVPTAGVAALMLGGLIAAETGVRLGGAGGVATFAVVAGAGGAAALLGWRGYSR